MMKRIVIIIGLVFCSNVFAQDDYQMANLKQRVCGSSGELASITMQVKASKPGIDNDALKKTLEAPPNTAMGRMTRRGIDLAIDQATGTDQKQAYMTAWSYCMDNYMRAAREQYDEDKRAGRIK